MKRVYIGETTANFLKGEEYTVGYNEFSGFFEVVSETGLIYFDSISGVFSEPIK